MFSFSCYGINTVCVAANTLQRGWTALMCAAQFHRVDCVRLLIDAGADKDIRDNVRVGRCFAGMPYFFIGIPVILHLPCYSNF
jgi:hypothetical protein